jgi:hypothetical protein
VENIPRHRDHHSGAPNQLITIIPEWVITIVRNPDYDHPGIGDHDRPESLITIVRNPQKGMGFHAFRRFRKTWLRGKAMPR